MVDLELNAKETALVLIDLEPGILAMNVKPHDGDAVVERCAKLAAALRETGGLPVYVHVLLHEMTPHVVDKEMRDPKAPPPPPAMSELVPEAGYDAKTDLLITKRTWDAFHGEPDLHAKLRARGIKTVIMGGIATNIGVESTARSAFGLGYNIVFAEDAMSTLGKEMQKFAVENTFPLMGRIRSTKEILAALEK